MSVYISFTMPRWDRHGLLVRWFVLESFTCAHGAVLEIGSVFTVRIALEWA